MHVTLLTTLSADHTRTLSWIKDGLTTLGHDVDLVDRPDLAPADASTLGYGLADGWQRPPDAVLALGWVAGLAAQVAVRELPAPVLLRLPRPGRSGNPAVTRVEGALLRAGATLLAASPSEAEVLVRLGALRSRVRVLPEAYDLHHSTTDAMDDVVVADDDTAGQVTAVLAGMAAGRPAVVAQRGVLPDLVADGVTGVVVPPQGDLLLTAQSLRADPMRRESMGMAAADRARACFDPAVVVPVLGRLLDEVAVGTLSTV